MDPLGSFANSQQRNLRRCMVVDQRLAPSTGEVQPSDSWFRILARAGRASREPKFENRLGCPATGHGPVRWLAKPQPPFLSLTLPRRARRFENRPQCPASLMLSRVCGGSRRRNENADISAALA